MRPYLRVLKRRFRHRGGLPGLNMENIEPVGRREQVDREVAARRKFARTWSKLSEPALNRFYNQNFVNEEIRKDNTQGRCQPYRFSGQGDSYFVSEDMFNSLVATCRCGRSKSEGHVIKCLQKVKNKYLEADECSAAGGSGEDGTTKKSGSAPPPDEHPFFIGKVPETSGGMIGWVPNRYEQWERSTRYISPVYTMPGHRIDERPYSHIFIG